MSQKIVLEGALAESALKLHTMRDDLRKEIDPLRQELTDLADRSRALMDAIRSRSIPYEAAKDVFFATAAKELKLDLDEATLQVADKVAVLTIALPEENSVTALIKAALARALASPASTLAPPTTGCGDPNCPTCGNQENNPSNIH